MITTFKSAARTVLAAGVLAFGMSLTAAQAATAPAGPAPHNAIAQTQSDVTAIHDRRGPRFQYRYNYAPRHYGFRYRPYYQPYYSYVPSCGWRKRCWRDNWGIRHCRWVNTCRRYD